MTAIEQHRLKQEPFYSFLHRHFGTENFLVFPLAGDASSRRYFRIVVEEQSWVLMVWEPFEDNETYPFMSVLRHFDRSDVAVPKVAAKSPGEGLILLEDLGDLTLERKFWENQNQEPVLPYYRLAIDELIKMHYPATRDRADDCTAFHVAFDVEKLMWEMNYARKHLLEGFCSLLLTSKESELLDRTFTQICERLDREPKYIAHRDYHSRNIMIKFGKVRIIDFQDARMGTIQYDLVSLLKDSYVELSESNAKHLMDYYLSKRAEYKEPKISPEKFHEIYELQSIQRCFKACGSFSSFYNMRGDTRYLKYISGTLKRVRESLLQFEEYGPFLQLLEDRGVFALDYNRS